jgi:hypothetical protein
MPNRLLSLFDNRDSVKLVIPHQEPVRERYYATLSHCWGKASFLQLTSSTLSTFRDGISLESLPKTFVEAIWVARKMSIPYIWIDSLCIMQDSKSDWATEAASMEDVYSNSRLNIMATASRDSYEGLFRTRDPRDLKLCQIKSQWKNAPNDTFHLVDGDLWEEEMANAPLNQRGWVLQERILPPRALHFGEHQLLWECRELDACEQYPMGLPSFYHNFFTGVKITDPFRFKQYWNGWYNGENKASRLALENFALTLWSRWIFIYTRTQLTRDSDRLIAFSGLAKRMRRILNDEYLAGLWKSGFVNQLLWSTDNYTLPEGHPRSSRPKDCQAPSWSWASVSGALTAAFPIHDARHHIYIEQVNVTPASTEDDAGAVLSGQIRARGFLKCARLRRTVVAPKYERDPPEIVYHLFIENKQVAAWISVDDEMDETREISVVVLPVLTQTFEDTPVLHCLLLGKLPLAPRGLYSRVGYFFAAEENGFADLRQFFDNGTRGKATGNGSSLGLRRAFRKLFLEEKAESWPKMGDGDLYLSDASGTLIIV